MVKLYGQKLCGGCQLAKEFLDAKGVEYEYLPIDTEDRKVNIERKKVLFALGAKSIPVLVVEGKEPVIGFDVGKYFEVLG